MRLFLVSLLLLLVTAACGTPTVVYVVVTATPETTDESQVVSLPTATATLTNVPTEPTVTEAPSALPEATTAAPTASAPTLLPADFPTPYITQVQVAEQLFEHGRMYWVGRVRQIWVLVITGEGRGDWYVYEDNFVDGEPETDPALVPPEGRIQPERGFGKLWREVPGLRDLLGWAVQPEVGYISRYEYHVTDQLDAAGNRTGYHVVYSLGGEQFRFNEFDSTWQLGGA